MTLLGCAVLFGMDAVDMCGFNSADSLLFVGWVCYVYAGMLAISGRMLTQWKLPKATERRKPEPTMPRPSLPISSSSSSP